MIQKVQNLLFYTLVFLIPVNLGKHFIVSESYVKTFLIDYLIPTVWFTDLVLVLLIVVWILNKNRKIRAEYGNLFLLFLSSLLPSIALASKIIPSVFAYLSLFLHVIFALYVASSVNIKKDFGRIIKIISVSVILVSVLGLVQWFSQGSIFDNYLMFGEQPYSVTTKDISLVSVAGRVKVPAYGLFRHPNVFAGFLAITLFWIYAQLSFGNKNILLKTAFALGFFTLLVTFSEAAMMALFLAMLSFLVIRRYGKRGVLVVLSGTFLIVLLGLFLPVLPKNGLFQDIPSIYRRTNLQKSAYMMLDQNALFGVGLNNFTARVEDYTPNTQVLRFIQPVHNIFALIFAEVGIFGFITFCILIFYVIFKLVAQSFGMPAVFFVTILQFLILGSFDHYVFTIQQTQLLFWLTVGFALTYTNEDVEV